MRASIERHTTANDEPATTNVDKLLQLVDTTLSAYKSKQQQKANLNNKEVTHLLQTLRDGITRDKTIKQTSLPTLTEDATTGDDSVTYQEENAKQRNEITNVSPGKTNVNLDKTNDNSYDTNLNDDLIKSLNPQGEVVVLDKDDLIKHKTINQKVNEYLDKSDHNSEVAEQDDRLIQSLNPQEDFSEDELTNDVTNHQKSQTTNKNTQTLNDNTQTTNDDIILDDELIKSLNPAGQVVVKSTSPKPYERNSRRKGKLMENARTYEKTPTTKKTTEVTNQNIQTTNDLIKLDDDLIKSLNPEGQVVVKEHSTKPIEAVDDNSKQPLLLNEEHTKDKPGIERDDIQNDLTKNLQTNVTIEEDSMLDDINDEEALIKSINPAGGVVVNSDDEGNSGSILCSTN